MRTVSDTVSGTVRWFSATRLGDVPLVGGKNASLGEMYSELGAAGVRVPEWICPDRRRLSRGIDQRRRLAPAARVAR